MVRFSSLGPLHFGRRPRRRVVTNLVALGCALLISSCLTPHIDFGDSDSSVDSGTGGDNEGGSSAGGGAPGTGGGGGTGGQAPPPPPHCENGSTDEEEGETDRNCGGDCPKCAIGKRCAIDSDCVNDSCVAGRCQDPDCDDDTENGSETDIDCGGDHCSECADGQGCKKGSDCESGVCKSGKCAASTCSDRVANGSETDVDCGGECEQKCDSGDGCVVDDDCEQPPDDDEFADFSTCEGTSPNKVCVVTCDSLFLGDCNQKVSDGCETNLNTSVPHCSACGKACAPANAVGECVAGNCLINTTAPDTTGGCLASYRNCNGELSDGCEVNINSDPEACGSCSKSCSAANGTPDCEQGSCTIDCNSGFDNCNSDVSDGCETNLETSTLHCSECGNACTPAPGEMAACNGTACTSINCNQPAHCGGQQPCGACDADSQCNDLLNTVSNCGGCGIQCSAANATTTCANPATSTCAIASCSGTYRNCNGNFVDGCEVDTNTNVNRCGGCLPADSDPNSAGVNCDTSKGTQVGQTSCSGGNCRVVSCNAGFADCNGTWGDGCEANLNTSATHCGGCTSGPTTTWDGGATCGTRPNATSNGCQSGICSYSCTAGWSNSDGNWDNGCEQATIFLANSSNPSSTVPDYFKDTSDNSNLTFSHTLQTASGNFRLVLVGVACKANANSAALCTPVVSYGATTMTQLGTTVSRDNSYASLFYLLDVGLPVPGPYTVTVNPGDGWTAVAAQILELRGVEQNQFWAAFATATGGDCLNTPPGGVGNDLSAALNNLPAGSRIYALGSAYSYGSVAATAASPLSLLGSPRTVTGNFGLTLAGGWTNATVTGNQTAAFALPNNCNSSTMFAVAIRPEANY